MLTSTRHIDVPVGRPGEASSDWAAVLSGPAPGQHIAQLYTEHEFLGRAAGLFVGEGLRKGEGVLVVATALHWRVIARRVERLGVNLQSFQEDGQLVVRDAHEMLDAVLKDGMPDREAFWKVVGGALDGFAPHGYSTARAFGEMVDVLRQRDLTATLRLEDLWKELVVERSLAVLCGYSIDAFDPHSYRGLAQQIMGAHSDVVPVEDYARLERAVERAYVDVFGSHDDARALRQAFLQHFVRPAAMPDAEAAILALAEFVPGSADELIESARQHYHSPPA